jgi:hypothetical protein
MAASDSLSLNMSCQALDCKKDFSHLNLEGFKRMRVKKNIARTEGFGIFLGSFLEKKNLAQRLVLSQKDSYTRSKSILARKRAIPT